jgi:hypothetical protein
MNLDDQLGALFADQRLDLPVPRGAEQAIVAGARRVRRGRIAITAVTCATVAAVLVGGGVALAGIGRPESQTPATQVPLPSETDSTSPSPASSAPLPAAGTTAPPDNGTSAPSTSVSTPGARLIGPDRYGKLTLGMSFEQARNLGVVRGDPPPPTVPLDSTTCIRYAMSTGGFVWITASGGVETLEPTGPLRTPQGVSTGWTIAQVHAIHPEVTQDTLWNNARDVDVPGNPSADYRFIFNNGKLAKIILSHTKQNCHN